MTFDKKEFRRVLGRFATGVLVATGRNADGIPVGVTINAFSSVSLDPPLVLFCLGREASCYPALAEGSHFALNILAEEQRFLSDRFAAKGDDKFAGVAFRPGLGDCPLLDGCLAHIECRREATHPGGDHGIVVGRVERLVLKGEGRPLLYFGGAYAGLGRTL